VREVGQEEEEGEREKARDGNRIGHRKKSSYNIFASFDTLCCIALRCHSQSAL
jgi:hypothetical protein